MISKIAKFTSRPGVILAFSLGLIAIAVLNVLAGNVILGVVLFVIAVAI